MELSATTKDITVEWLNEVLHENGFLGSSNIISLKHAQIGVGEGLTSDIARLHLTYDNDSKQLPSTIIAKLPTTSEPTRTKCLQTGVYTREIQVYKEIIPSSPIRTPNCYFSDVDSENEKFVLLLEDCAKYSQPDYEQNGISYEQAKTIALAIAEFHARWWDDTKLLNYSMLRQPTDTLSENGINLFRMLWETSSAREDFKQYLPKGGFEVSKLQYDNYHLLIDSNPKDKLTITHSDLRADNVYIDDTNEKQPVIVYDWAMAMVWRGAADISFLLGTSVDTDLRRNIEKDLIQQYHNRLIECGVMNYSFDECWEDYLKGYLWFTGNPLACFGLSDRSSARGNKRAIQGIERWFAAIIDNDAISLLPH